LVQHDHGIIGLDAAQRLNDASRHCPNVGAAMPSNLGLVANATERHACELAPQGPRYRLSQRCLADAGRTNKTENRLAVDLPACLSRLKWLCRASLAAYCTWFFRGRLYLVLCLFGQALFLQAAYCQVFKDAILDFLPVVV